MKGDLFMENYKLVITNFLLKFFFAIVESTPHPFTRYCSFKHIKDDLPFHQSIHFIVIPPLLLCFRGRIASSFLAITLLPSTAIKNGRVTQKSIA